MCIGAHPTGAARNGSDMGTIGARDKDAPNLRRAYSGRARARAPMICVYVARQRFDAYLVADRLNQAGIRAHVFNEHASSIAGDVPPEVVQPQVWLADDDDAARARALLQAMEREARLRTTSLYCRHCGEQSPGNFDLCWNCGTAIA